MASQLGVIGGGMMAEALLSRLLASGLYAASDVLVSEPQATRQSLLRDRYGIQVTGNNSDALAATVVLLAIKPQVFPQVAAELAPQLSGVAAEASAPRLLLSILAGTAIAQLEAAFPGWAVVRAMPNTPATVGAGISALAPGHLARPEQVQQAHKILAAVGEVVQVPESLLDAVTGLSGSGPGYVALFVEALSDGGVAAGLPRAIATQLAIQTLKGSAQLLQETGLHPGQLKDQVTSPGGTTITGIAQLERAGFRSALIEAVKAATARSRELGQG
jgi:pyrroline-5-carboxylate reductase